MSQDIQGLIDKINQEGLQAASLKAQEIESQARAQAAEIIAKAKAEAVRIIEEAKKEALNTEKNSQALLKQAGRDMILTFKKEINNLLNNLASQAIGRVLTPEETGEIIIGLIRGNTGEQKIILGLKEQDLQRLEEVLFVGLNAEVKKGITLKPEEDIQAGFIISYDAGRSYYDFSDKAIADYIVSCMKPKLAEILSPK